MAEVPTRQRDEQATTAQEQTSTTEGTIASRFPVPNTPTIDLSGQFASYCKTRASETHGKGIFALQDIPKGARILSETALVTLEGEKSIYSQLIFKTKSLPAGDKKRFLDLSSAFDSAPILQRQRPAILEKYYKGPDAELDPASAEADTPLYAIYGTNSFETTGEQFNVKQSAIFATAARFNHSCIPNLHWSIQHDPPYYSRAKPSIKHTSRAPVWSAYTTREIKAGEELTIDYVGSEDFLHAKRAFQLVEAYGFVCTCADCVSKTRSDELRASVAKIRAKLEGYLAHCTERRDESTDAKVTALVEEGLGLLCVEENGAQENVSMLARRGMRYFEWRKDYGQALRWCRVWLENEVTLFGEHGGDADMAMDDWRRYVDSWGKQKGEVQSIE